MTEPDKEVELLRAIYRAVDWRRLYELAPQVDREAVDAFFVRLRDLLRTSARQRGPEVAPSPAEAVHKQLDLYCDGASSGNPGPAAIGVVLLEPSGREVRAWGRFIGKATNNVAEYEALIAGLHSALELGAEHVNISSDSQLLVRQVQGTYKVKDPRLRSLHARATKLLGRLESWQITQISSEQNRRADAIARAQIKAHARKKPSN